MDKPVTPPTSNFRHFFFRGLAIVLPSVLTIWILVTAYNFVQVRIAEPINVGIREAIVQFSSWPAVTFDEMQAMRASDGSFEPPASAREAYAELTTDEARYAFLYNFEQRRKLERRWQQWAFPLDLIGLIVAIIVIYILGGLLGSYIGKRLYSRGEELLGRVPLIRNVYPSVKQVTDFLFGGDEESKQRFSRVVAVQYPRKGLWSIALVTGETMQIIQDKAGEPCVTLFVPSSPTPFTGYVITVPVKDTVDLPITIEDALRFTISGGVVIPRNQQIPQDEIAEEAKRAALPAAK